MTPKISVIIPVYNTGNILVNTVNSVLNQSFTDFELLLIDDGSDSKTAMICDLLENKDKRIKVFHKKNGGICDARNYGLNVSSGKYVTFCDHDDLYYPNKLLNSIEIAEKYNVDMVSVNYAVTHGMLVTSCKATTTCKAGEFCCKYNSNKEILSDILYLMKNELLVTIWNNLYKKDIIKDLYFDTSFKGGHEDILFNFEVIKKINSFYCVNEILYNHVVRDNFSTSTKFNINNLYPMVKVSNALYDFVITNKFDFYKYPFLYISTQGNELRLIVAYSIKSQCSFCEFTKIVQSLKFFNYSYHLFKYFKLNKESVCYLLLQTKSYRFLFLLTKIFYFIKRKLRGTTSKIKYADQV